MMIIYPAIDLKDGKCVRLHKGDMESETIYNDNPGAQAKAWAMAGFSWIHVVDLNGAVDGKPVNETAVQSILSSVDLPIQLGGGIRTIEQVDAWIMAGVSRVILGTSAVKNPELVWTSCDLFPGQIAVGIDARQGRVAIDGWTKDSGLSAVDLARQFEDAGVCALIYTDIDRDGTGTGLNMEETLKIAQSVRIPVIASGGVGSLMDVQNVKSAENQNVHGMIIGKALYDGRINAREALALC